MTEKGKHTTNGLAAVGGTDNAVSTSPIYQLLFGLDVLCSALDFIINFCSFVQLQLSADVFQIPARPPSREPLYATFMKQIHLNINLEKSETGCIATTTVRLWSYIPSSLSWLMRLPYPASADIVCGRSVILLTNLALLAEGFLTDIIVSHIENSSEQKKKDVLEKIYSGQLKWKDLITKFKEYFDKDLNDIPSFKSIEILFLFRNNIAHGKTYSENSTSQNDMQGKYSNSSIDKKYEKVRQYLIEMNVIRYEIVTANQPKILDSNVPIFFYLEVKKFLFNIIDCIEFNKRENIKAELTNSYIDSI